MADDGGVWVKVWPDMIPPGIEGLGDWALIEEVSGTYTKHPHKAANGTDAVAYEFIDDGTVKTTDGLVETLIVGGGGSGDSFGGLGGAFVDGVVKVAAGANTVTVGQSVAGVNNFGTDSWLGSTVAFGGRSNASHPSVVARKHTSSITGADVDYCMDRNGPTPANRGAGAVAGVNALGSAGVVIIRVPLSHASNVTENFYRWLTYATVTDGVVTSIERVPDNEPHTLGSEWLPAHDGVQVGWSYTDGEFTPPPPPTREDLISELQNRIDDLHRGE